MRGIFHHLKLAFSLLQDNIPIFSQANLHNSQKKKKFPLKKSLVIWYSNNNTVCSKHLNSYITFNTLQIVQLISNAICIQYPVAAPSSSITRGITFFKCLIYFLHFSPETVSQNSMAPCLSSSLFLGLTSLRKYSFNSCQRFSIGFKSGDSGGVFHHVILLSLKKSLAAPKLRGSYYVNMLESLQT